MAILRWNLEKNPLVKDFIVATEIDFKKSP